MRPPARPPYTIAMHCSNILGFPQACWNRTMYDRTSAVPDSGTKVSTSAATFSRGGLASPKRAPSVLASQTTVSVRSG